MAGRVWRYVPVMAVLIAWDVVATLNTRYIADQNWLAIPSAAVLTLLWVLSVRYCSDSKLLWAFAVAAMAGTAIGIYWP